MKSFFGKDILSKNCKSLQLSLEEEDFHYLNKDQFPLNENEWFDSDWDGVGDNEDAFPNTNYIPFLYFESKSDGLN